MTGLGILFVSMLFIIFIMLVNIMGLSEEVASLKKELEDYK